MKKHMKLACMLIALLMVAAVFAGCDQPAGNETEQPQTTQTSSAQTAAPATEAPPAELEPFELDWYLWIGTAQQNDLPMIQDALNEYAAVQDLNVTVELIQFASSTYTEKMRAVIAAGGDVDLCFSCTWALNYLTMIREGWFTDITDLIGEYAPDMEEVLSGGFIEGAKYEGRLYTMPCNKEKGSCGGVLFNKEMLEKYNLNIDDIDSYDDVIPWLEIIKENESADVLPINTCRGDNCGSLLDFYSVPINDISFAVFPLIGGTEFMYVFDMPEVVEILKIAKQIADAGYVRADAVTITDKTPTLKAGNVFCWHEQLKPGKDTEVSVTYGVDYVQKIITPKRISDLTGSMMAIPLACPDPARVLMFYNLFYCDEYAVNLLDFGIEGVHYVKVSDNVIDFGPDTEGGTASGYLPNTAWTIGNQFLSYLWTNEDPEKWAKFEEFNAECLPTDALGFYFDRTPVADQLTQIATVDTTENISLRLGLVDDVDEAIASLKAKLVAAGWDEVVEECNRQFNEWKARN